MKSFYLVALTIALSFWAPSHAFAPLSQNVPTATKPHSKLFINIGEPERESLTRDSEPEDFFAT